MMFRYYRFFLILIIAALTSCNQYNRILEEVYDNDQAAREWTRGMSSLSADEIVNYSTEMERVDSLNQATVFGILDKEGWPSHLSDKANRAIWIVIDHSDLAYRSKYLGLVKEKAEHGVLDITDYAILNDRVLMEEGKPQIYGTQVKNTTLITRFSRNESNSTNKLVASYSILDNEHSPAIHCKGIHFSVGG